MPQSNFIVFDREMNAVCCLPAFRIPEPTHHGEVLSILPSPRAPMNQPLPEVKVINLVWHAVVAPPMARPVGPLWWYLVTNEAPDLFDDVECMLLRGAYVYADLEGASERTAERRALICALDQVRAIQRFAVDPPETASTLFKDPAALKAVVAAVNRDPAEGRITIHAGHAPDLAPDPAHAVMGNMVRANEAIVAEPYVPAHLRRMAIDTHDGGRERAVHGLDPDRRPE